MTTFKPLREIITFKGGGTPSKQVPEYWDGDIPWATVKDFTSTSLSSTQDFISQDGLINSSANLIPKGHVIIPTRMSLGKAAINAIDLAINQDLRALIPKVEINTEYLLFAMLSLKDEIVKKGAGATVKGITQDELYNLKIPLPPLDDQIRIAHLLSKVEGLIAQRKQHLQQLDDLLKSVFLEMFGIKDGSYKDWTVDKLGTYAEIVSGVTKGKKYKSEALIATPYMRVANVQDGHFVLDEIKKIAVTQNEIDQYQLRRGDLLLTEGGDPDKLGRGSVWEEQIANCIHQNHIFRVRIKKQTEINPYYLSALVGSIYGKAYFLKSAKQTTGIASINSTQLKNFPTVIPPIDLQNKFAAIVKKVEVVKSQYQQSLAELENIYGALSQKAFKGELDLSRVPLKTITANLDAQQEDQTVTATVTVRNQQQAIDLPDVENMLEALATIEGRQRLVQHWLEAYLAQLRGSTFSVNDFLGTAQVRLSELHPENDFEIGIPEYDQLKVWVFETLGNGRLAQIYDDAGNRVQLVAAKG
jgi:type I restriction enzyme S subunit